MTRSYIDSEQNHFRLLFENAPLGYQSLDEEGRILHVNAMWLSNMGYEEGEVMGRTFGDFATPNGKAVIEVTFPHFKECGEIHGIEIELQRKDGSVFLASFDGRIQHDNDGNFLRTHCIMHDITARKKSEEELRSSRRQLRALTVRLADAQEAERKRLAQRLHDEAGVHLATLAMGLNLLRDKLGENPGQEILSSLDDSVSQVEQLGERIRNVMSALRPPVLDDYGLLAALRWHARSLSSREREVLQLVVEGKSSKEIADEIHLSRKTVETYRARMMTKLNVKNVLGLVKFAIAHGITPGE